LFYIKRTLLLAIMAFIASCSGGGGGSVPVSGSIVKGPVNGATVNIYAINADGSRGVLQTTVATDVSGNWNAKVTVFPFEAVALGGTYNDESSGVATTLSGSGISAIVPSGRTNIIVTPLTSAMADRAKKLAANGSALMQAITTSETETTAALGFNPASVIVPDPLNVPVNATPQEKAYAKILLGVSELVNKDPALAAAKATGSLAAIMAVAADMLDGKLNSQDLNGNAINVTGNTPVPLPVLGASGVSVVDTAATTLVTNKNLPNLATTTITSTPTPTQTSNWGGFNWDGATWN